MKLIDLSQPLYDGSPNCPAHPAVRSEILRDHPEHGWRVELLTLANHSGSHVDAPLHKIANGDSLDQIPLEKFVGHAWLIDLRGISPSTAITADMLKREIKNDVEDQIILLATGWGEKRAHSAEWLYHSPYLSVDGAKWLVKQGIRGVGIDHYSIAGASEPNNAETHTVLLEAGIWIVEELRFPPEAFKVPQPVQFMSLPINLQGHSGAFCRPVIVTK